MHISSAMIDALRILMWHKTSWLPIRTARALEKRGLAEEASHDRLRVWRITSAGREILAKGKGD